MVYSYMGFLCGYAFLTHAEALKINEAWQATDEDLTGGLANFSGEAVQCCSSVSCLTRMHSSSASKTGFDDQQSP